MVNVAISTVKATSNKHTVDGSLVITKPSWCQCSELGCRQETLCRYLVWKKSVCDAQFVIGADLLESLSIDVHSADPKMFKAVWPRVAIRTNSNIKVNEQDDIFRLLFINLLLFFGLSTVLGCRHLGSSTFQRMSRSKVRGDSQNHHWEAYPYAANCF